MTTFLITAGIFAIAILGMAVGVILSNRRLRGSCGGIAGRTDSEGNTACQLCSSPSPECTGEPESKTEAASQTS